MSHGPYKEFVIDGALLHCPFTSSSINLKATDIRTVRIQKKEVCTETDKVAVNNSHSICLKTLKPCVPILMEWINARGRAANVKSNGHILLLDDAKVKCVQGDATLSFLNSGQTSSAPIPGQGYVALPKEAREAGFALRHPFEAWRIGAHKSGSNNISTIAVLFANGMGWDSFDPAMIPLTNAFRHTIWQAIISSEYGNNSAQHVGYSHEDDPLILRQIEASKKGRLVVCGLLTPDEADEIIDLQNNIIGRRIGLNNPGMTNNELAKALLEVFYNEGLYVLSMKDKDFCEIGVKKIDKATLQKSLDNIEQGLDHQNSERQNERG